MYYTGKGDDGSTEITRGERQRKSNIAFEAIGTLDELNSQIGVARIYVSDQTIKNELLEIQNDLFAIGADLYYAFNGQDKITFKADRIKALEDGITRMGGLMPPLKSFVIPGGGLASAYLHLTRAVARRAERDLVKLSDVLKINQATLTYMNRLSSYLFVAALYSNYVAGIKEINPHY